MTGFGAGRATAGAEEISVELKSVNSKFCEVKARVPREMPAFEVIATKTVKDRLARGTVDVSVRRTRASTGLVPVVDVSLAKEFHRALKELRDAVGVSGEITLREIATQPGVLKMDEPGINSDDATNAATQALAGALEQLIAMRITEGAALKADLLGRVDLIEKLLNEIKTLTRQSVQHYQTRLTERIAELSRGMTLDPQRLAQEVALFADRTDVTEEMTRFDSHIAQFRALLNSNEPSGRKMDFLVQELHREINTTGSKSQHAEIAQRVVTVKTEIERIREQVQNVE